MQLLVHVIFNVCAKYEFSIFNHSKDIEGSQNVHFYWQNLHCACTVSRDRWV